MDSLASYLRRASLRMMKGLGFPASSRLGTNGFGGGANSAGGGEEGAAKAPEEKKLAVLGVQLLAGPTQEGILTASFTVCPGKQAC